MSPDEIRMYYPGYAGWGEAEMMADFAATGGAGKGGGGGTSGGGGGSTIGDFSFNYQDAYTKAYESLKPYYQKVLDQAGGDLDLAKRIIQSDYELGNRETRSEYEAQVKQQAIDFPQEQRRLEAEYKQVAMMEPKEQEQLMTTLNRRGVAQGGLSTQGQTELTGAQQTRRAGMTTIQELSDAQRLRQEAIKRAMDEKESRLVASKSFGTEKEQRAYDLARLRTGQEHSQAATGLTESQFNKQLALQGAGLAKTQAEEASRLAGISSGVVSDVLQKYGYQVG